jgi:hypothetical protein
MTCNTFASLFEKQFVALVRRHLRSKKLEEKALSLLYHRPPHTCAYGKIKATFLPQHTTALVQPTDKGITRVSGACYHSQLPGRVVNSELQVTEFLKTLTLKDVAYSVRLAWGNITLSTIAKLPDNVYRKRLCHCRRDEVYQEVKAACDALDTNSQPDGLASWMEVDDKTTVAQHLGEEDAAACE